MFLRKKAGKLPAFLVDRKWLILLFPLDRGGWLAADVINDTRYTT